MPLQQKTIRQDSEILLDKKVNELIKDGWSISSDVKCVIIKFHTSGHNEIWYQTLTKFIEQ